MSESKSCTETLKIYTLSDTSGNVFYVGCTITSLEQRLAGHLSNARTKNAYCKAKPKNKIISSLNYNIVADVVDIKEITAKDRYNVMKKARAYEKEWIYKYIGLGFKLCNREAKAKKADKTVFPDFVGLSIVVKDGKVINPQNSITHA